MTATPFLALPYIASAQAQKHVTHNEALSRLDAAIQLAVLERGRAAPPASPAEGDRYIVAAAATGAWAGHAQKIAFWADGVWQFLAPRTGWCVWSIADRGFYVFDGAGWWPLRQQTVDNAPSVGVNASADAYNRLAVRSNAALFAAVGTGEGGSGDIRLQLSRENAYKTASAFFSDNYSGRAEFGLIGSGAFKLKTSADGNAWREALAVDVATGRLSVPQGLALAGVISPPQLTADVNDYAPAGYAGAVVMRLASNAARAITGLAGGDSGAMRMLVNVGGADLALVNNSAASLSQNRFALAATATLAPNQTALLWYDGISARWRLVSRS